MSEDYKLTPEAKEGLKKYRLDMLESNRRDTENYQHAEEKAKGGKIGALKECIGQSADLYVGNRRFRGKILSVDGAKVTVRMRIWGTHGIESTFDIRKISIIMPLSSPTSPEAVAPEPPGDELP